MTTRKAYYVPNALVSLGGKVGKQTTSWLLLTALSEILQEREELRIELVSLEAEMKATKGNTVRDL